MGSAKQTMLADLLCDAGNNRGKIVVRLDCINASNDDLVFKFKANLIPKTTMGCCNGSNNPYSVISRARENNGQNSEYIRVFSSDYINNNSDPSFKLEKLKLSRICNGDRDLPIRIALYTKIISGTDQIYG